MAWFDSASREPNWVWLLTITREYMNGQNYLYGMRRNKDVDFDENNVLKKFLNEIDSRDLVTLIEPRQATVDPSTIIFGGRHYNVERISLFCLEEDVGKLETNEPVHFQCPTEIGINDKEEFMKVIRLFIGE